jgi:arylsulfatase A-like enzyme
VRDSRKFSAEGREPSRRSDPFYSLADHVTERALALLELPPSDAEPRRDFFWFHYFDPHDPYGDSGNSGDEETVGPGRALRLAAEGSDPGRVAEAVAEAKRLYDRDVTSLDRSLARVLAWLERDAATTDTHVMILSDHGESFGEGDSMAHGRRLIASQLHVPCLIRSPRVPTGARTDIVGSVDLATTLLALVGVTSDSFAGRNLTLGTHDDAEALGMRRAYEKPFRDPRLDGSVEVLEGLLFYRVGARGEIARGHAREPTLSADLQARFAGFEERLARNAEEKLSAPDVDAKLRALGYVE